MRLPANWKDERWSVEDGESVGHEEGGSTIAIHSLAVDPEHQGKQVGSTLMKSYIQRIRDAQIAERIAIIVHDHLIPFYESFGFESHGPSKCQFGGGNWVDMVGPVSETANIYILTPTRSWSLAPSLLRIRRFFVHLFLFSLHFFPWSMLNPSVV